MSEGRQRQEAEEVKGASAQASVGASAGRISSHLPPPQTIKRTSLPCSVMPTQ